MTAPTLSIEENRRQRQAALYPRTHGPECADRYRAIAEWWRIAAEESANPAECLRYAANQERLAGHLEMAKMDRAAIAKAEGAQ